MKKIVYGNYIDIDCFWKKHWILPQKTKH